MLTATGDLSTQVGLTSPQMEPRPTPILICSLLTLVPPAAHVLGCLHLCLPMAMSLGFSQGGHTHESH